MVGLTLGLAGGTADAAQAPAGTIRVEVLTGPLPLEAANVSANGMSAATDASGVATLTLPRGSASLTATKDGYDTAAALVDVVEGRTRTIRLVLIPVVPGQGTVVSSTRMGQRLADQAGPVALLGRDEVEARMLKSPGDSSMLFDQMVGLRTQMTSPVLGTTGLRIRGLPSHYTRLLSDGMPLYGDRPGGHALLRIPPMDRGQIEVIKEPASALFGSDAIGVVNLLSARPGSAPERELLFNQSSKDATDAMVWISSPPSGSWSRTFLFSGHRQSEADVDHDGWSDVPEYQRAVARPGVFWNNGRGRMVAGTANVTFEKREGGGDIARESLETKTADGSLSGQMPLWNDYILAGAAMLFVQSRTHDFSDGREGDRFQTATIELTLRRPTARHTWLAGIAADWYALRSSQALPSTYVSTRPGIFVQDDLTVTPWLLVSGNLRLDHHNLYGFLLSPRGSALLRGGSWEARFSASQGYFTPRPLMEETEAAGLARLTVAETLEVETARSVSAEVTHRTDSTAVTLAVFRSHINDPAQIDRTTYTLRTETEPIVSQGVEILVTMGRAPFSVTGTYAYVHTREHGDRDLALTPRHRVGFVAAAGSGDRGRIGVEGSFTGEQRLDRNPYRSTSESYGMFGLFGERRFGRVLLFVNADNLTDVRQTNWDPIARPAPDVDGRWTVDAWAPLKGRAINAGIRLAF